MLLPNSSAAFPTFLNLYLDNNMHTYGLPTPECWGWYPVAQSKSGAIGTIGNTGYGYGVLGGYCTVGGVDNWITTEFFVQYGTYGHDVLGEAFEQAVMDKIDSGKAKMVIDLSGLEYISSAGLRVLLMAAKQVKTGNGALALCGLKDHIREVFEISGFLPILTIVDDESAALTAVGVSA